VLGTLEEIGATVEVKSLGARPRLQEPEYLAINPAGTLPALIDGDRAIYESLAICEYLAARHGSDLVVAPDEPDRPEFVQWITFFPLSPCGTDPADGLRGRGIAERSALN
jgi:glutathione S-transferase